VKLLPVLVILTAITVIGINGNQAFADAGNTVVSQVSSQGGVQFDVVDPDGIKSVKIVGDFTLESICIEEFIPDPLCGARQIFIPFFCPQPDREGLATIEITDCQPDMSTSTWEINGRDGTAFCVDNCGPPPPCNVFASPTTLDKLLADEENCLIVDDKIFRDFRNYDGGNPFFEPSQIIVDGVIVNGEKGLQFFPNNMFTQTGSPDIVIDFDYNVISQGTPIIDNTLTLDSWNVNDPQQSQNTGVDVSELVFSDPGQSRPDLITSKRVFENGDGNIVILEHKEFAPQQSISVSVIIGLLTDPTLTGAVATVSLSAFTQTFSQEEPPEEVPVGGKFLPIETTSLLLSSAQTFSWMIPVILSGIGIGLFVVSRKSE